jgi:hypothetical protein
MKRILPLLLLPLLLAGCKTTLTNLTPLQQTRSTNDLYMVEAALSSRQQTMRWQSIRPQVLVGKEAFPMRPTPLMTNRFEALIPVPATKNTVNYRYKFDFDYNSFGQPKTDSALSQDYTLRILEKK